MTEPTLMTTDHPQWREFCDRLEGEEGCNFRYREGAEKTAENVIWNCGAGRNKDFATKILADYDVDIDGSLTYFDQHGGHCDCEILFNVDR